MAESVKQRLGQSKLGKMSNYALYKLINAAKDDLNSAFAVLNNVTNDMNNIQVTLNNLVVDIKAVSNNTAAANNTVQITATAPTLKGGTAPTTQTLVA